MSLVGGDNCFQTLGLVVFCEKLPGVSHFFQQGLKGLSSFAPQLSSGHAYAKITSMEDSMNKLQFGTWVDNSPKVVETYEFWKTLKALGYDLGAVMIDTALRAWDPIYSPGRFKKSIGNAIKADASASAVVWPVPNLALINQMCDALETQYLPDSGVVGLEGDQEHLWTATYLDIANFGPNYAKALSKYAPAEILERMRTLYPKPADAMERAGVYFGWKFGQLAEKFNIWTAITTHTGHREMSSRAVLSRMFTYLNAQLYSTETNWRHMHVPWESPQGPGRKQVGGLAQLARVPGMSKAGPDEKPVVNGDRLGVGLAAWDQKWIGHSVMEAVATAFLPALRAEPRFVMIWSSKWGVAGRLSEHCNSIETTKAIGTLIEIVRGNSLEKACGMIKEIIDKERSKNK